MNGIIGEQRAVEREPLREKFPYTVTIFLLPSEYAAADRAGLIIRYDRRGGEWLDSVPRVRVMKREPIPQKLTARTLTPKTNYGRNAK